jgi:hypothetical protein
VQSGRSSLTFQRCFLPPSPGQWVAAASTSEMSINFYQTTQHNNPEDSHLYTHHCENLKSHSESMSFPQGERPSFKPTIKSHDWYCNWEPVFFWTWNFVSTLFLPSQ